MNLGSLKTFIENAENLGVGPRAKVQYAVNAEGVPVLYVVLPPRAADAVLRAAAGRKPTKAQEAVREQLQARREAVRAGEKVPGHMPPVAKGGRKLKVRKNLA